MKTKVLTKNCKNCTKCVKLDKLIHHSAWGYSNELDKDKKYCVWGKSKKLLTEPKGNEMKDCKLIGR
jgi:hypothetical protein